MIGDLPQSVQNPPNIPDNGPLGRLAKAVGPKGLLGRAAVDNLIAVPGVPFRSRKLPSFMVLAHKAIGYTRDKVGRGVV